MFQLRQILLPLLLATGTRVLVFFAAYLGLGLVGPVQPDPFLLHGGAPHPRPLVDLFQRWDSYWFLNIAREGYHYYGPQGQLGVVPLPAAGRETNITPFPLYPVLMALLGRAIGDLSLAGLLLSLAAYLASMVVLFRLTAAEVDEESAGRAVLYLSLYPTAFIYNAIYSEALFLLLTLLALRAALSNQALRSGLFGLGASLTRLGGVLLVPCQMAAFLARARSEGWGEALSKGALAATLTCLGWLGYFLYLQRISGRFWLYFSAQQGWRKSLVGTWTGIGALLAPGLAGDLERQLYLVAATLFLLLAVAGIRRLRPALALYLGLGTLMPLCSSNLLGLPRYLMVLFPAFMLLGAWGRRPWVHGLVVAAFGLLFGPVMLAWLRWRISL